MVEHWCGSKQCVDCAREIAVAPPAAIVSWELPTDGLHEQRCRLFVDSPASGALVPIVGAMCGSDIAM